MIAGLNADPTCTGYIVQLPLPGSLDDNAALALVDPDKDADGLHPVNLGKLVLGMPGLAVHAASHRRVAPPQWHWTQRRGGLRDRPRYHGWPAARTAADAEERERDGHPVPHRDRRSVSRILDRLTLWSRRRADQD